MFKHTVLISSLTVAGLLLANPASAATYSVSGFADGSASACDSSVCGVYPYFYNYTTIDPSVNSGNVDTSGSTTSPSSSSVYETGTGSSSSPYATSTSWTKARVGTAHAYASVKVSGVAAGTAGTEARARAFSNWTDQLTVTSPIAHLPFGTPVTLLATLVNEGTVSTGGDPGTYQYWNLDGPRGAGGGASFTASNGGPVSWGLTCDNTAPGYTQDGNRCVKTVEIPTAVGDVLNLSGDLQLKVYADFGAGDNVVANATADYSNTSYVTFTSETGGASFTTASGTAYVAPVPLPAPLWLMLSGMGGLTLTARRRAGRSGKDQEDQGV